MLNDTASPQEAQHDGMDIRGRAEDGMRVFAVLRPVGRQILGASADHRGERDDERLRAIPYRCSATTLDSIQTAARQRGMTPSQLITRALLEFGIPVMVNDIDGVKSGGELR
ncbi:hypothetical protein [Falsiroseomonas sp.]|uniref:hypothetical protein n=1 Tax=Falsiroseomonas sp. TaxID=2870721 RepID=UPI003F710300